MFDLTVYRLIPQLLECSNLAIELKKQYLDNYKRYHRDRHRWNGLLIVHPMTQCLMQNLFQTPKLHGFE